MNSSTLSVHSRRPNLFSSFPEWLMEPPVDISSSRVASTLDEEVISWSRVAALFFVVSDKCLVIDNIFSVTLSCWVSRLARDVPPVADDRFLSWFCPVGSVIEKSSCLSAFSISSIVEMLALRNACVVLYSCSLWLSTDLLSSMSPSSRAKFSSRSMHRRMATIFSRPASFNVSSSGMVPRKARMS